MRHVKKYSRVGMALLVCSHTATAETLNRSARNEPDIQASEHLIQSMKEICEKFGGVPGPTKIVCTEPDFVDEADPVSKAVKQAVFIAAAASIMELCDDKTSSEADKEKCSIVQRKAFANTQAFISSAKKLNSEGLALALTICLPLSGRSFTKDSFVEEMNESMLSPVGKSVSKLDYENLEQCLHSQWAKINERLLPPQ